MAVRLVRFLGLLFLISIFLSTPLPTFAQNPISITIDQAGFDDQGHVLIGAWFPVVVTIENGGGDVQGTLTVETNRARPKAGQTLDLPGGARKQVTLLVRNDGNDSFDVVFSRANAAARVSVGGRIIAHQRTDHLIGLVGTQPAALAGFNLANTTLVTIDPTTMVINDATLANFKVLVVSNLTPTTEQVAALNRWVMTGGLLIVDSGASSDGIAPEFADLVPATVDMQAGTRTANFATKQIVPTASDTFNLTIRPVKALANAQSVASDGDQALIVRRDLGLGSVLVTAFDVAAVPIERGKSSIWTQLIKPRGVLQWVLANQQWRPIGANTGLPSSNLIMGLLLGYILMIGPFNYLLLRKLDRREWAWFSIPLLVLLFVGIAYVGGKDLRNVNLSVAHVNVLDGTPDSSQARMTSMTTVNSGRRSTWTANLAAPFVAGVDFDSFSSETNADLIDQRADGSTNLPQWRTNIGSTSSIISMGFAEQPYQFDVQNLVWDDAGVWKSGTIKNLSKQPIENASLVYNEYIVRIPPLAPNATFTLDPSVPVEMSFPYGFTSEQNDSTQAMQMLYDQMYQFDQTGSMPKNSVYNLPRIIILDETPRLPLTFEEDVVQKQINIYNIYVPAEGTK